MKRSLRYSIRAQGAPAPATRRNDIVRYVKRLEPHEIIGQVIHDDYFGLLVSVDIDDHPVDILPGDKQAPSVRIVQAERHARVVGFKLPMEPVEHIALVKATAFVGNRDRVFFGVVHGIHRDGVGVGQFEIVDPVFLLVGRFFSDAVKNGVREQFDNDQFQPVGLSGNGKVFNDGGRVGLKVAAALDFYGFKRPVAGVKIFLNAENIFGKKVTEPWTILEN